VKLSKVNTIIAIAVCILLPVSSYFIIKKYTDNHVKLPRKYFYDRVLDTVIDGRHTTDTIWHQVRNIQMVNQHGDTVNLDMLKGKVLIVDFFFTHCPTICPALTRSMKRVQQSVMKDSGIHLISITIDPARDSVTALRKYALQNGIRSNNWWLCRLTGGDSVAGVMYNEFKAGFKEDSLIQFDHSTDIYLLDKNRIVRGKSVLPVIEPDQEPQSRFYEGTRDEDVFQLINDAGMVKMEKNVKGKPPILLLVASMVILGITFFGLMWWNRRKKKGLMPR
jgi:protein SCO1